MPHFKGRKDEEVATVETAMKAPTELTIVEFPRPRNGCSPAVDLAKDGSSERAISLGKKPEETDFARLSDGSVVEMIENREKPTLTQLAVYRKGSVRYTEFVEDEGKIFVAPSRAREPLRYVSLANGAEHYGQVRDLRKEVSCLLRACLDLDEKSLTLMTAFVITTWLHEELPIAPYLALVGPPGSGKTTAMRVLSSVCYRGLFTTDFSSSAFYEVSHCIRPTILLDETLTAGNQRQLIHLLKSSSTPDAVSLRKDKARLAYGPKVFAWLELPDDSALNSRCLIVPIERTSKTDLKRPNDPRISELARQIRTHLLQFRFERITEGAQRKVPLAGGLSGRQLDLYEALASPFGRDQATCRKIASFISAQDELQRATLSPIQASILRVLYYAIHAANRRSGSDLPLNYLAKAVNWELAKRGEPQTINERKLGSLLTSMSLTNRARSNKGYVLCLTRSDCVRIHKTFLNYCVGEVPTHPIKECKICAETGVNPRKRRKPSRE